MRDLILRGLNEKLHVKYRMNLVNRICNFVSLQQTNKWS
jgi:hypothetical protein